MENSFLFGLSFCQYPHGLVFPCLSHKVVGFAFLHNRIGPQAFAVLCIPKSQSAFKAISMIIPILQLEKLRHKRGYQHRPSWPGAEPV